MIRFERVSKVYRGGRQALQKIDFHDKAGQMTFLTGHSGAGKSTFLKLICALTRPSDGSIYFNGHNITRLSNRDIPFLRRQIGIVFQDYQLIAQLSAYDNIALPLRVNGLLETEIKRRVRASLDKVGLLDKANCLPGQLSGGEQQRVGIARAIVNKPMMLLADEPTGNLDPELAKQVMEMFAEFNRVGVNVIIATHDTNLLETYDYPRLVLENGHLL